MIKSAETSYKEHGERMPAYRTLNSANASDDTGLPRWGNSSPPPAVGSRIMVTINNCGPATVTGYFTEGGYLGIIGILDNPPEWHRKQNNGNRKCTIFGPEQRPL